MTWEKRGRIFDPRQYKLPAGCEEFAQAPQALVFDEFVRIYFSTRSIDPENGKYLSHIAYVDMDKRFREVIGVSAHTVMPLGGLGCFDEHGIFPMNVLRDGRRILAYTCGWSRRVSVSVETGIGLAISEDNGTTFERFGYGPVMTTSPQEPYLVGDPFVKTIDGLFHMWYIFGTAWKVYEEGSAPDRTYKIGHAISRDGLDWLKEDGEQIVQDRVGPDECQALPTVIEIDGRYHILFCYRHSSDFRSNSGRGYRIGHAYSDDLNSWIRDDGALPLEGTPGAWDSDMQCYPHLFECDAKICLLYNGNEFGRYGFGLAELEK